MDRCTGTFNPRGLESLCNNPWCNPDQENPEEPHYNVSWCKGSVKRAEGVCTEINPDCESHVCLFCHDPLYKDYKCVDHSQEWYSPPTRKKASEDKTKVAKCAHYGFSCEGYEKTYGSGLCADHLKEAQDAEEQRLARFKMTPQQIKEALAVQKEIDIQNVDDMIDLDWWFQTYGEEERPSKFMNRYYLYATLWDTEPIPNMTGEECLALGTLSKHEATLLGQQLKDLEGAEVNGGTHIWTFTGQKHYKREGQQNQFACLPVDRD